MNDVPLYEMSPKDRGVLIRRALEYPRGGTATGPREGAYGEIYVIDFGNTHTPQKLAAKCPRFVRFGSPEKARIGVENILYELEKTHSIYMLPWINRFFDVQIIHGWPFVLSRFRDGTLEDLIKNPLAWTLNDKFTCLLQIIRCLILANERGISAHQDLKPANIFFDDLKKHNVPSDSPGMHQHFFLADFGLANAYKEIGTNNGSRPYMAPEQHDAASLNASDDPKFDVFALGVIAHEFFTDGRHPIGCITSDVWPWQKGIPQKWNRKAIWEDWASLTDKSICLPDTAYGGATASLISKALAVNPIERPSLIEFEVSLSSILNNMDTATADGFAKQVDHLEGLYMSDIGWPHMDQKLLELRDFYSRF